MNTYAFHKFSMPSSNLSSQCDDRFKILYWAVFMLHECRVEGKKKFTKFAPWRSYKFLTTNWSLYRSKVGVNHLCIQVQLSNQSEWRLMFSMSFPFANSSQQQCQWTSSTLLVEEAIRCSCTPALHEWSLINGIQSRQIECWIRFLESMKTYAFTLVLHAFSSPPSQYSSFCP